MIVQGSVENEIPPCVNAASSEHQRVEHNDKTSYFLLTFMFLHPYKHIKNTTDPPCRLQPAPPSLKKKTGQTTFDLHVASFKWMI